MITRHHEANGVRSWARYSDCEIYRYALARSWDASLPRLTYVMLNPSRATEAQNDPTIERCQRRAIRLGYGAFCAVNLFALRETDPTAMRRHHAPEGPGNADALCEACAQADLVLCAWGVHGAHLDQGPRMAALLRAKGHALHCLGTTKDGHPRHPLYLRYDVRPTPWH